MGEDFEPYFKEIRAGYVLATCFWCGVERLRPEMSQVLEFELYGEGYKGVD